MSRQRNKTQKYDYPTPAASHGPKPQAIEVDSCENPLRPWLLGAMMALFVARPLFPSEAAAFSGDGLPMVMLWIALGVFWFVGAIIRPTFILRFGWTDAAVLLLIVWNVVAALWAAAYGSPRPAVNMLWEWIGLGLCFFLARQLIVTSRERRAVVSVMIALAVGVSGYGLYQRCYELPEMRAIYAANPDEAMRQAGLWFPPDSPERKLFESRLNNTEPFATFALTNSLAAFLSPWLVMLVGVIGGSMRNRKQLLALAACLIPVVVCLLLTKSRSGYIAVCVGILLVWLFGRANTKEDNPIFARAKTGTAPWKLPTSLAGIAVLLLSAALMVEGPAVLGRATKSFGYRVQYWQSSLKMIAAHPWLGCGPGNFQLAYTEYKLPEASEEIADPHNFLLEIWATAGTPAVLAFLAALGCCVLSRSAGVSPALNKDNAGETPALRLSNSAPSSDGWRHVLGGGTAGFLLSAPLGVLSAAPPGVIPVLLGLPLAAVTLLLMFAWIREGELLGWLPGVCVASLLINLLAAGGIGMPSIAGTFWLLLALAIDGRRPHMLRNYAAWAGLAVFLFLLVACYRTAYSPVLKCEAELRLAEREPSLAVEHLRAAAAVDPFASEPWRRLAAIEFESWWQQPDQVDFTGFTAAKNEALRLAPNSASMWLTSGDWACRASSRVDQRGKRLVPGAIESSIESYSRAVQLYPNSALHRAKLAEAYFAAGDRSAFRREAEIALQLDKNTPHADKKLLDDLRKRLSRSLLEK